MDGLKIYDAEGTERDWEWLWAKYGVNVTIQTPNTESYWRITEIREQADGSNTCVITSPPGTPVIWYYTTAPELSTQYNREWHTQGDVDISDTSGYSDFGMFSNYWPLEPPYRGPYELWCGTSAQHSENLVGLGMPGGFNHHHLRPKYVWVEGGITPPPDDWEEDTTARLESIELKVDDLWTLLNHIHNVHCGPDPE